MDGIATYLRLFFVGSALRHDIVGGSPAGSVVQVRSRMNSSGVYSLYIPCDYLLTSSTASRTLRCARVDFYLMCVRVAG